AGFGIAAAFAFVVAFAFSLVAVRLAGVYLAMLTLAFAQIAWSIVFQGDALTGGSNGLFGLWPPAWLADKRTYYAFAVIVAGVGIAGLAWMQQTPFGYALRAA